MNMTQEEAIEQGVIAPEPTMTKDKLIKVTGWDDPVVRAIHGLTLVAVLSMLVFFGTAVYWTTYDDNPPAKINMLDIKEETLVLDGFTPVQVHMKYDLCRYTEGQVELRATWVNAVRAPLHIDQPPSFDPGCYMGTYKLTAPGDLHEGDVYLEVQWSYKVNPLTTRSVTAVTDTVTVIRTDKTEGEDEQE